MPLYCGVNGVKHKIKGLYTGVGGVKKELTEMWAAENGVKKLVYQAVKGTPIGSMKVGSIVKINENGKPVNYLIVHQGLPSSMYDASCNGTWLLRQDIAEERAWSIENSNMLEFSDIFGYLSGAWLNRYDPGIRDIIKQVKIPYRRGGGENGTDLSGVNGISCKAFLLSGYEVGWSSGTSSYFPTDGAKLSYFLSGTDSKANAKRIAKLKGSAADWWLRSPHTEDTVYAWCVNLNGGYNGRNSASSLGIRPAIILPQSTLLDDLNNVIP